MILIKAQRESNDGFVGLIHPMNREFAALDPAELRGEIKAHKD